MKILEIPEFSTTQISVSTGITNVDEIIDFGGSFKRKNMTKTYPMFNSLIDEMFFNTADNKVYVNTNNQYVTFYGYVNIFYTKTTDEWEDVSL